MNEKNSNFYFLLIIISIFLMISIYKLPISAQASNSNINNSSVYASFIPVGNNVSFEFYGAHPGAKNNTTITSFIDTYGISTWVDDGTPNGDDRYRYIYIIPKKNSSKKLVFLFYRPDQTRLNNSVVWVKLIDLNETLPTMNASISATSSTNSVNNIPGFTMNITIVSIISILLVSIYLRRK